MSCPDCATAFDQGYRMGERDYSDLLAAAEEAYSAIREYDFLYHKADGDVTEQRQAVFAVAANLEAAIKKAKGQ